MNSTVKHKTRRVFRWATVAASLLCMSWATQGQSFTTHSKVQTITINDDGLGSPNPSSISVSGKKGNVGRVRVSINNLQHTNPDDVAFMLVYERAAVENVQAARSRGFVFMSNSGGPFDLDKADLVFDDKHSGQLPDDTAISSGNYKPTNRGNYTPGDFTGVSVDETAAALDDLTNFNDGLGSDGNGSWKLYVLDDQEVDAGQLEGWDVHLQNSPTIEGIANQSFDEDGSKSVEVKVADNGSLDDLVFQITSSNTGLIPNGNLVLSGSGATRSLEITSKPDENGVSTITLNVFDGALNNGAPVNANDTLSQQGLQFDVTVNAKNDSPTITSISNQTIQLGGGNVGPIEITLDDGGVTDNETAAADLRDSLVITSSSAGVIPVEHVQVSPTADAKKYNVVISPNGNTTGSSTIKLKITDNAAEGGGGDNKSAETSFSVTVSGVSERSVASTTDINQGANEQSVAIGNPTLDLLQRASNIGITRVVVSGIQIEDANNVQLDLKHDDGAGGVTVINLLNNIGGDAPLTGQLVFDDTADKDDPNSDNPSDRLPNTLPGAGDAFPLGGGGLWRPAQALAGFQGQSLQGTWTLTATGLGATDFISSFAVLTQEGPIFSDIEDSDNNFTNGITITDGVEDNSILVNFIIADSDTNVNDVQVTGSSSNANIVADGGISVVSQSGSNRSVRVTPVANANGLVSITLTAKDNTANASSSVTFDLSIAAVNDAPTLAFLDKQVTRDGQEVTGIGISINDVENDDNVLTITSSNDKIVPFDSGHIVLNKTSGVGVGTSSDVGNDGDTWDLTLFPVPQGNKSDTSTIITVKIADQNTGSLSSTRVFELTVRPATSILTVNPSEITIRDNDKANPFPSTISVSGVNGTVDDVSATIAGLNHDNPDDLEVLLVAPNGVGVVLMSGTGGANDVGGALGDAGNSTGVQLTFSDLAGAQLTANQIVSGTYQVSNLNGLANIGNGPNPPTNSDFNNGSLLGTFGGVDPNGDWKLYITDNSDASGTHFGRVAQGWSINITTKPAISDLPSTLTLSEDGEQQLTFTIGDDQGSAENWTVTATSNHAFFDGASSKLTISPKVGSNNQRHITIKPDANENSGTGDNLNKATITVAVDNNQGDVATHDIELTVTPVDDLPVIDFTSPDKLDENGDTVAVGQTTQVYEYTVTDQETTDQSKINVAISVDPASLVDRIVEFPRVGNTRSFQIVPSGIQSGQATVRLTATPASGGSSSLSFNLTLDGDTVSEYSNKSGITIPISGESTPYPASINVSGLVGEIEDARVVIDGLTHAFPEDLDIVLQAPSGKAVLLLSDIGGNQGISDVRLEFNNYQGTPNLVVADKIASGVYAPTNQNGVKDDNLPTVGNNYEFSLNALEGEDPNGVWKLFVHDDNPPDSGSIEAFYLILKTGPAISIADLVATDKVRKGATTATTDDDVNFLGVVGTEDQSFTINFTVGDSDTNPDNLTLTAESYTLADYQDFVDNGNALDARGPGAGGGTTLVPRNFKTNGDNQFVDSSDNALGDQGAANVEAKGVRTDLLIGGSASKRTLTIKAASNLNTDGDGKKGGSGANKNDAVDPNNDAEEVVIRLTASDGVKTVSTDFLLDINRVNDAPSITSINGSGDDGQVIETNEDTLKNVSFTSTDLEDNVDSGGVANSRDRLTYTVTSSDQSIIKDTGDDKNWLIAANGGDLDDLILTLSPRANAFGDVTITIDVQDDDPTSKLSGSKSFTLRVKSVNDAPLIGKKDNNGNIVNGVIDGQTVVVGSSKVFEFHVSDTETAAGDLGISFSTTANIGTDPAILPAEAIEVIESNGTLRKVRVTPAGLITGAVDIEFKVTDADGGTATAGGVTLTITDTVGQTVSNVAPIQFFDNSAGSPYSSDITFPNGHPSNGEIRKVTVTLDGITHANPDDIDIVLEHNGVAVSLLSDAGGEGDLSPKILKFADSASGLAPDDSAISVGVYKPTNYEGSETLPGNAPSPGNNGYSSSLADFNGQTVGNPWKLFVSDDTDNDLIGEIQKGWKLNVETAPIINGLGGPFAINEDETFQFNGGSVEGQNGVNNLEFLAASSSNPSLIPAGNVGLAIDGAGDVTLTLKGAANANSGSDLANKANITFTLRDKVTGHKITQTASVTVAPINDFPEVIGLPRNRIVVQEEQKVQIPFTVNDIETDNGALEVTWVVTDVNGNATNALVHKDDDISISADGSNRTLTINPVDNRVGVGRIAVTVSDGTDDNVDPGHPSQGQSYGALNSRIFEFELKRVNDAPVLTLSEASVTTGAGDQILVDFTADDTDSDLITTDQNDAGSLDPLVFTITSDNTDLVPNDAANLEIINLAEDVDNGNTFIKGKIKLNPVPEKEGSLNVTVTVTDSDGASSTQTLAVTVRPSTNHIFVNDGDADEDVLTDAGTAITINDNGNADPYPAELEVSGLVGPLKAISVILRDVNHTFPGDMDVLLVGPNGKSVVLMSDQGSNGRLENVDLTFNDAGASLANNNNIGSGTYKPSDNDAQSGDTDNFEGATDTSQGSSLNDAFLGIDPNGTWALRIVDDAGGDTGEISNGFLLSLQTGPTIGDIADATVDEDSSTKVSFTVADQDTAAGSITVTAASGNQDLIKSDSLVVTNNDGDVDVTITPTADANGTVAVTITAKDEDNHTATASFNVTINPTNDNPTLSDLAGEVTIPTGTTSNVTFNVADGETANGDLTITASAANGTLLPEGSITQVNNNGAVTLTLTPATTGSTVVSVSVSDGQASADGSFIINVIPAVDLVLEGGGITINDNSTASPYPSVITVADRVGEIFKATVAIEGLNHSFVSDVDMLLVSPSGDSILLMSDVGGTRGATDVDITFDSSAGDSLPRNAQITSGTFKPTDGDGGQSQQDNVFASPAPQNPLSFTTDLGVLQGDDPNGNWSLYVVDDTGADAGSIANWKLTLTTLAPLISGLEDVTLDEDGTLDVALSIAGGSAGSVSASSGDQTLINDAKGGLTLTGEGASRTLTITPVADANGTAVVTVTVTNGPVDDPNTSAFDQTFNVTINPTNDAPTVDAIEDVNGQEDTAVVVAASVADIDSDVASLVVTATTDNAELFGAEGGVTVDGSTVTLTPAANASGSAVVTVTVSDGELESSTSFTATIEAVNDAPVLTGLESVSVEEDGSIVLPFGVSDEETRPGFITVTAVSFNTDVIPNEGILVGGAATERTLTVTPTANASGEVPIRVTARDQDGRNARANITVTVEAVNDAPVVHRVLPWTVEQDNSLVVPFGVTDVDSPLDALTVTSLSFNTDLIPADGLVLNDPVAADAYSATLSGENQNPAVETDGSGEAIVIASEDSVFVSIDYGSLGSALTAAHIHGPAGDGENAGVLLDLMPATGSTEGIIRGNFSASAELIEALSAGQAYVNLHTENAGSGELRANLAAVEGQDYLYTISVTPAAGSVGSANVRVQVRDEGRTFRRNFTVNVTEPSGPKVAIIDEADIPSDPGSGLDGKYWQRPVGSIGSLAGDGLSIIRSVPPTATFTSTVVDYSGNDLTPVGEWLGDDGASLEGASADNNLDDGLFFMSGFIKAPAGTFRFRSESDDGSIVWISGQKVIDNDGSHGAPGPSPDGEYTFPASGLYPIEIAYFNGDWTNDAGDHGGASILLLTDLPAGDVEQQQDGLRPVGGGDTYTAEDIGVGSVVPAGEIAQAEGEMGTGLSGEYFVSAPKSVSNLQDKGGEGDIGLQIIRSGDVAGRFIATNLEKSGNDLTPIQEWLGDDSASYRGIDGDLNEGLIRLSGFLRVDQPGMVEFASESDDGSILWIAGEKVVDNDGSHGAPGPSPTGTAFFPLEGLYPIEIAWFNGNWTNDAGEHGGANIKVLADGEPISADRLYPAASSMMLTDAVVGTGLDDEDPDNNDPAVAGSATITTPFGGNVFDVEVTAGGGDIWGDADRGHFVYTEWSGDFDTRVEVTRLDAINRWSKAGISVRETIDAGSRHVWVNVDPDNVATVDGNEGADRYELGVRAETGGGMGDFTSNGGEPIVENLDVTFPTWIRVTRRGNEFTGYRSSDGLSWTKMSSIEQEYPETVLVALGTTSHNNDGEEFLTTAHYQNFTIDRLRLPAEPPVVELSFADGRATLVWNRGKLQSAPSVSGPWTDVTFIPGRGQPPQPAQSPFEALANKPAAFYRLVD